MEKFTKGLLYLRQAHKALMRDFRVALDDQDWNIAVRRAQECIEFAAKGLLLIIGEEPIREHNLRLRQELLRSIPLVAFQLQDDYTRDDTTYALLSDDSNSFYLCEVSRGVVSVLATSGGWSQSPIGEPFGLEIKDNIISVTRGNTVITRLSDFSRNTMGRWIQSPIAENESDLINNHIRKLFKERDAAFYFDKLCTQSDAENAGKQAEVVLRIVLGSIGLKPENPL